MPIKQCDNCGQQLSNDYLSLKTLPWTILELCIDCAAPIAEILKKYEVSQKSPQKSLRRTIEQLSS